MIRCSTAARGEIPLFEIKWEPHGWNVYYSIESGSRGSVGDAQGEGSYAQHLAEVKQAQLSSDFRE